MSQIYKLRDWINQDKINWAYLSRNPNAIHLLEQNPHKIKWNMFAKNPNIFVLNYEYLKARTSIIKEELIMRYWHPSNIEKWLEMYGDDFELYI